MRTLGLIGGISWESTQLYYQALNRAIAARLGAPHSAKVIIHSIDFAELVALQQAGDWEGAGRMFADVARGLVAAGADLIAIGANTMHKVTPQVGAAVSAPLVDVRDAVAAAIKARGLSRVVLLGTRYTAEGDFYGPVIAEQAGCAVVNGTKADRDLVHQIIYDELTRGVVRPESRAAVAAIIERLRGEGADGVILGCTELVMLDLEGLVAAMPMLDSMATHAAACVEAMLA